MALTAVKEKRPFAGQAERDTAAGSIPVIAKGTLPLRSCPAEIESKLGRDAAVIGFEGGTISSE